MSNKIRNYSADANGKASSVKLRSRMSLAQGVFSACLVALGLIALGFTLALQPVFAEEMAAETAQTESDQNVVPVAHDPEKPWLSPPYAPFFGLSVEQMNEASSGCVDCHTDSDAKTMHNTPGVVLGCAHCHGGDPKVRAGGLDSGSDAYQQAKKQAHVQPKYPEWWPTSANPEGPYTNSLKESWDFVRFINPGDLRVADQTCGACHANITRANRKSLMTTSAMLWGGASYNNNILPYKNYILGESYGPDGVAVKITNKTPATDEAKARGALDSLIPMPQWESIPPGDVFRIFERGGERVGTQFPEIGNPNPFEIPGKPDVLQSNRGKGTGSRIAVPVINIHKTRLNDPHLSLMGTNDNPGDYRNSGCTGCHVVYANDRTWSASGPYAKYGNEGKSYSADPTIPKNESGHPIRHEFSRGIPTAQCMVCHMHQPNMFVNTYLGFTMWDYESDAPFMWPEEQKFPTHSEQFEAMNRNPEEAVIRGKWSDKEFSKDVSLLNPQLKDGQFADYHGHGWNFRGVFKKDRKGNLLDKDDKLVSHDDPAKFKKAVHMMDIHAEKGMHCADCHFGQDSHGDGNMYGEVAQQVEIRCQDCHGTVSKKATLKTSGPAAPKNGGNDLSIARTSFGDPRFEWIDGDLWQHSGLDADLKWRVKQVVDSITPGSKDYNSKSAKYKLTQKLSPTQTTPSFAKVGATESTLAHSDNDNMACFTCHTAWTTSCGGCHLPIQANWKQKSKHYDGKTTRNWASYNPQVARDQMFQIGRHGPTKGGQIVPIRSSSALILSSRDINRQLIYIQQPPVSAAGYSSQAFAPHFPHVVRTKETKQCDDCHVSQNNDNNAIVAQLLLHGTNFVNFLGFNAYVATGSDGFEAVQVSEWEEPQAVIGSYLHKYAYPKWFGEHEERGQELETSYHHGVGVGVWNPFSDAAINRLQMRGEYLYTTAGSGGFRVYDIANVANKGFSERMVTAPFSPLGHDTHVTTENATSFALPTNQPVAPFYEQLPENLEQPMHEIYHYAVVVDSREGLILVNVDTLQDGDRTNNFLERALTWNEGGVLSGARSVELAGNNAFIGTEDSLVIVDLDKPLEPRVRATLPFNRVTGLAVQFRYVFVTDASGLSVVDTTNVDQPTKVATLDLPDARGVYVARTFAYVAGGSQGLVIVNVEKPDGPSIYMVYNEEGTINDLTDVKVATTNASLFGYLADGVNGLKVVQLTDPERVPTFYGYSPDVKPMLIAWRKTGGPAVSISKPLDRDRAVDETGGQIAVLGRIGSRPFNQEEQRKMYLNQSGQLYTVDSDW